MEDATPVVSTPNPQAHTLAKVTGVGIDNVELGLILLVALLVEMGGLGPFITMNLAKVPKSPKVPEGSPPGKTLRKQPRTVRLTSRPPSPEPQRPRFIHSAAPALPETIDLESFLNRHAHRDSRSALGSSDLLARYNRSRRESGLPEVSQRRLGDAMRALGHRNKLRLEDGRIHYQGLAWRKPDTSATAGAVRQLSQRRQGPQPQVMAVSHLRFG